MRYTTVNAAMKESAVRQMSNAIKLVYSMRRDIPVDCPRHQQLSVLLGRMTDDVNTILALPEYGSIRDKVTVKERPADFGDWQMPDYEFRCPQCNTYYRTAADLPIDKVTECGLGTYACTCGYKGAMQYRGHHVREAEE